MTQHDITPLHEMCPSISIVGVTTDEWNIAQVNDAGLTALKEKFRSYNPFLEDLIESGESFNILFIKPPKGNFNNFHVVARVSPKIRDVLHNRGNRIVIEAISVRVYDRFYVKRCNRCNGFGHYANSCQEPQSCGVCASLNHQSSECDDKNTTGTQHLNCINCKRSNRKSQGHSASSRTCETYIAAQKKLKVNIPYYQGKNWPPPPRR